MHPHPSHPAYRTRPANQVFPEDIECVLEPSNGKGGIYIGNLEAAENLHTLKKHSIASVLTACKNVHIRHPKQHVPYSLYIPGEDHENYDLSLHFDTATHFIHQSRKETNILVHCMAGISRSVTLVIAYLMKYLGMTHQQAHTLIKRKRSKINPNPGFVRQLQQLEGQLKQQKKYKSTQDQENVRPDTQHHNTRDSKYSTINADQYYTPETYYSRARPSSYKPHELTADHPRYTSKYAEHPKVLTQNNLQLSDVRTQPNPEYDNKYSTLTNTSASTAAYPYKYNYDSPLKPAYQRPTTTAPRHSETINHSSYHNYSTATSFGRNSNIDTLSKDLDDRIAKIKQKYYERSNFEGGESRGESRVENDFGPMSRSRASRDALRGSVYNSYNVPRPFTYQYA